MAFCQDQVTRLGPLWDTMLSHRFLIDTRDGTISDDRFAVWMRQDYLFAGAEERERMAEYFELTTKYEIAFWEMVATGEQWPGAKIP